MRFFTRGDIDGFFGLFIDNLLQLMLIQALCVYVCGFPVEMVTQTIMPGAAISILVGNLFYGWQAWRLMKKTGRTDITALPYGINTPSLIAYIFLIMLPVYQETQDATIAWQAGLFACFVSGVMETAGAFCADWLRRHTPRAALLTAIAGIAITFISMNFIFQLFAFPEIAVVPMLIILFAYAAKLKLPLGVPAGLLAVLVGTGLAWGLKSFDLTAWKPDATPYDFGIHLPKATPTDIFALLSGEMGFRFMAVIIPMGIFNILGSLQNLESAEAAGDRFETRPSLLCNGIGTLFAAALGSPFPTTIYIGHPGWKAMGARAGYSVLNGIVISVLCLIGGVTLALKVVPIEATLGILLWIGIVMTGQAFSAVPRKHAPAVAFGLIPSFAAWAYEMLVKNTVVISGKTIEQLVDDFKTVGVYLHGMIALNQGFLLSSMMLAAVIVFVLERKLLTATYWLLATAGLAAVGLIHAYDLTEVGVVNRFAPMVTDDGWRWIAAPRFTAAYVIGALFLLLLHFYEKRETKQDVDG